MKVDEITGKVPEEELELLAGEEVVGGVGPTTFLTITIEFIKVTLTAAACPTSSCTKSCNS